MRKPSFFIAMLTAWLIAFAGPCLAARGYAGYYDTTNDEHPYNGVKSTIDFIDPTVGSSDVAAWCGIDNRGVGGMKWLQVGWGKRVGEQAKIYWEYTDKDGNWNIGYGQAPTNPDTYEVSRGNGGDGDNVEWKHGDTVYKTAEWSKFDTITFTKAEYTAEAVDPPADRIPGTVDGKNKFVGSAARTAGNAFATAALANQSQPLATNGNVEKYGDGNHNFRTWYAASGL